MTISQLSHTIHILPAGNDTVQRIILQNKEYTVELTNTGASIVAIYAPDKNGTKKNIVAGFEDLSEYNINKDYLGCVVGRCTNRIANGRFTLNGKEYQLPVNNGINHLHGGFNGFHLKHWQVDAYAEGENNCSVTFSYISIDGEEGYPGTVHVKVQYVLSENSLTAQFTAVTDKDTPINLTNHSYFNLSGFEQPEILNHTLQINADYYTEKSPLNVSTGKILSVTGTALDFRISKTIGKGIHSFPADMGYDYNFVLQSKKEIITAAILNDPFSGRTLTVYTNKPGIHIYTANYWDGSTVGTQNKSYIKHGAVALETQLFPDSVNHPHFPDCILKPGEVYDYTTIFQFDIIKNAE